jgi:signal peptidase I
MMVGKKGTWRQAIAALLWPAMLLLILRWQIIEPYLIPSQGMEPTLLENDYILVNKFTFGLRLPFSEKWLVRRLPARGEIVVFRNPSDPEIFFIKRVVGLPGDTISCKQGRLFINDRSVSHLSSTKSDRQILDESVNGHDYQVYVSLRDVSMNDDNVFDYGPVTVPQEHLFVMGDNRDHSSDSRTWGFLHADKLIGKAVLIWLSCEDRDDSGSFCNPAGLRRERLFRMLR